MIINTHRKLLSDDEIHDLICVAIFDPSFGKRLKAALKLTEGYEELREDFITIISEDISIPFEKISRENGKLRDANFALKQELDKCTNTKPDSKFI